MARKVNPTFPGRAKKLERVLRPSDNSWAVIGIDTSMSSIAMCAIGFDAVIGRMTEVRHFVRRWETDEDDYFQRLSDAANAPKIILNVIPMNVPLDRMYVFQEEPVPLGMIGRGMNGAWVKQQCEVSGAVLGGLYKYGYKNIWQINNATWKSVLRKEGVTIRKMPEGKWDIKEWAMAAYGLPDLPDLVKSKTGGKIPRPESGFGAKAKAVQPDDVYDAAACMAFGQDYLESVLGKE